FKGRAGKTSDADLRSAQDVRHEVRAGLTRTRFLVAPFFAVLTATPAFPATSPDASWLHSKAGVVSGVLPGFAPIEGAGSDVRPWGRDYGYADLPLPSVVTAAGESLLASPPRLVVDLGHGPREIRGGRYEVVERQPERVRLRYAASAGAIRVEEDVT